MSMPVVVFTDLDDTLFQTARKLRPEQIAGSVQVTVALNGQHSLMTEQQAALLGWINPKLAIPVTARGSEAFARVDLNFGGYSIVANGAVILSNEGVPDNKWQTNVIETLEPYRTELAALPDRARAKAASINADVRTWLVQEPSCGSVYAVVKVEPGTPEAALNEIAPALMDSVTGPWRLHLNGNNLALIPPGISKAAATSFLLSRIRQAGPILAIGMGDSSSDLEFMQLCDLWMTPNGSQLDRAVAEIAR